MAVKVRVAESAVAVLEDLTSWYYRRDPNAVRVVRVWRGERLLRLADE